MTLKQIKVSDIVYMNVVCLLGMRWFSTAAQYGAASIILWILASLLFFVPISFVFAEFSSIFPDAKGGLVDWTREVFGERTAFITSWFYLICNIFYYPTVLTYAAICLAYVINPELANNKVFITTCVIASFWIATFINIRSVSFLAFFGKVGGLIGNIIPIIVIVILAAITIFILQKPMEISFAPRNFIPEFNSTNLIFLATMTFAMSGGEICTPFVKNMKNPKKDFAKATLLSALVITICYIVGTLALAVVIDPKDLGAAAGPIQVIAKASSYIHMEWIASVIAIFIVISCIASTAIWMVGTIKMFTQGNDDKFVPKWMRKENKHEIPVLAIIAQAVFVSLIVLVTSFMKSVENIYMVLVMMATVPMFIVYLIILLAYLKLKFKMQTVTQFIGQYVAPGKKFGAFIFWIVASFTTLVTIILPILSPGSNNIYIYETEIICGPLIFFIIALLMIAKVKRNAKNK